MNHLSRTTNAFLCLCTAALLAACEEPAPEVMPVVRPVKIHTIGSLDSASIREYPGTIRAFQTAEMGFEVAGRVTDFYLREGESVTKGTELAEIDPRDYESQLKASEADLRKARADLQRSENIYKQEPGAISTETIDTHRRAVEVAQAKLEITKKALEDTVLRAPFDGIMARKLVEDFANVQAKEPILIMQDMSVLEIEVDVPERDIAQGGKIRSNEEITQRTKPVVIVSSLPDRPFKARIKEIAARADPETRTFPVKLNFDNPEAFNILPGMTARVRVVIDPQRAWSVPVQAAQADESGKAFVWKINPDDMKVSKTDVTLGEVIGDRVLITSGVAQDDMIAVSGVTQLRDGMQVREYRP